MNEFTLPCMTDVHPTAPAEARLKPPVMISLTGWVYPTAAPTTAKRPPSRPAPRLKRCLARKSAKTCFCATAKRPSSTCC